ncbi:MAG: ATP-binding protein [Pseudomonadota bacterium]
MLHALGEEATGAIAGPLVIAFCRQVCLIFKGFPKALLRSINEWMVLTMRTEAEKDCLLKAIDAFRRRLIVVSPQFEILAANRNPDGQSLSGFVGKLCHQVFYQRGTPCQTCAIKDAHDNRRPTLRPKESEEIDLGRMPCLYAYPIMDGDRVEALVSMDFDIPTSGGIERVLQQSNALLRNLIRSSVDGVIAADLTGKILIFNVSASHISGYSEDEALHQLNIRDIYPEGVAYRVMHDLRSDDFGGRGKLKSYPVDSRRKDGELVPISLNAAIVYEKDREVATIGFFHDLREELSMVEKYEKTKIQLHQAEKMASLGKLAAGVAHQLNNPLGGITLFTKLVMEEYDLPEGAVNDLERVLKDAERCRDTVKELLEFTRQTRHLMNPQDINKAISRTLFLLERQSLFQNVEIVKDLAEPLPTVLCDIQQINHMIMNLVLNAAQAMDGKGTLTLRTFLLSDTERVGIEITDTGSGIADDVLPHIFDPFFTTKEEGKGTGLGLSLVYNIVENHGGVVKATSKPGRGTTFRIELPLTLPALKGEHRG